MRRVNSFFMVLLAVSSVCFGATLMQRSVSMPVEKDLLAEVIAKAPECEELFHKHQQEMKAKIVKDLYNEAFHLSFLGEATKAKTASVCAAWLERGLSRWEHETKDWIN